MKKNIFSFFKKNKKASKISSIVLIVALVLIALVSFSGKSLKTISEKEAREVATNFINSYLMEPGAKAFITEVSQEYGLYKFEVDILSGKVESYLSKDGKFFFPQALNVEEINSEEGQEGAQTTPKTEVSNKTEKPVVELFVMSHCPYGTQVEKGILPVVEALGDDIDFRLMFNDYAMHGEKELVEQMNQECIMNEQEDVFYDYLACFLEDGDSDSCIEKTNVDKSALVSCVDDLEEEHNIIADFNNKVDFQGNYPSFKLYEKENNKYNVAGSPTLIINEENISSRRDPASLLYAICSAFVTQPDACYSNLSTQEPVPGFGTATSNGNSSDVNCE